MFGALSFSQLLNQQLEEEKRVHAVSEEFLQKKFEVKSLSLFGMFLCFSLAICAWATHLITFKISPHESRTTGL